MMKKVIIVSILVIAMVFSLSTVAKATDIIEPEEFDIIEEEIPTETTPTTPTTPIETTQTSTTEKKDETQAKTENPQTGVKEEAPIIITTIIGICVAVYAGIKIRKYNY